VLLGAGLERGGIGDGCRWGVRVCGKLEVGDIGRGDVGSGAMMAGRCCCCDCSARP